MDKPLVHPLAHVDVSSAYLGEGIVIGPYCMVGANVRIGNGTILHGHVTVHDGADIGAGCEIFSGAVIGCEPQHPQREHGYGRVQIGDGCLIREHVVISRGFSDVGQTRIGDRCTLLSAVNIGHDCLIKPGVLIANGVQMAANVTVDEGAVIGALSGIHQQVRIGMCSMVGAMAGITRDFPSFCCGTGVPARIVRLNKIGIDRYARAKTLNTDEELEALNRALHIWFRSGKVLQEKVPKIKKEVGKSPAVKAFLEFVQNPGPRGISRYQPE